MQVNPWELIGALAVFASGIAWLVSLQWKQRGHEDLCSERYKKIEERHAHLVKVSDERHTENRERLEKIDGTMERMDEKMDRLLSRAK